MEQNQQSGGQGRGRRGHFNRGRRPDRRPQGSQEPRASQSNEPQAARSEHVDVEQIMRDIRARIAHRHGIDLSTQQVSELAARRLEAILDPRNVNPSLLEQLRKAAGTRPSRELAPESSEPAFTFEDSTLYDTHRGLLRTIRKLLNPLLRLFFNPNTIVHALNTQARLNAEHASRENERAQQQAEWNALHFELLKRVVTESARLSIELQALTLKVESLATRVDFADRRVRSLEAAPAPQRHNQRASQDSYVPVATPQAPPAAAPPEPGVGALAPAVGSSEGAGTEGQRRRRRRRRGRRSGGASVEGNSAASGQFSPQGAEQDDADDQSDESADSGDEQTPVTETEAPQYSASSARDEVVNDAPAAALPPEEPGSSGSAS
ncbi:MAG: hypothetical protein ABL986_01155 [Vicinamibacterales bacterium]